MGEGWGGGGRAICFHSWALPNPIFRCTKNTLESISALSVDMLKRDQRFDAGCGLEGELVCIEQNSFHPPKT